MSCIIVSSVSDYLANITVNALAKNGKDYFDNREIKTSIKEYIESQQKYNEVVTREEEIDFQGLADYIENNLMDDINKWLYGKSSKERGSARQAVIAKAVSAANAETDEAKARVVNFVSVALNIIRDCINNHIPKEIKLLVYEATDEIISSVKDEADTIKSNLESSMNQVARSIETISSNPMSIDNAVRLAKNNQWTTIEDSMESFLKHLSAEHPLAPDYGVAYESGFKSIPLTDDAISKYPPRIELSCNIFSEGGIVSDSIDEVLDYHKRHQLPLTVDVKNAVKYLGNIPDPFQNEAERSSGSLLTLKPPQLSNTVPCSIKVRDKTFFDLVYIKVQEILDDGTFVIGNKGSESDINFELRINPSNPEHPQFAVKTRKLTNHEYLKIASFYCELDKYKDLHIYCLSAGEDLIAGKLDFSMATDFGSMDNEVDFLQRVCEIEDYFNLSLPAPREVSNQELSLIVHVSNLIREEYVNYPWKQLKFSFTLSPQTRELIAAMNGEMNYIYYIKDDACTILGNELRFRYIRYIEKAKVLNYDKVEKKLEVLEDGDVLNITVIPESEESIFDSLRIPDELAY